MYTKKDVCAFIISYNDANAIRRNVSSVISQSDKVLVIDNASTKNCTEELHTIGAEFEVEIIFDDENRGLATQYNRALEYCHQHGYRLLLTMDQDTSLEDDCVQEMLNVLNERDEIGTIGPNRDFPQYTEEGSFISKNYIITSGSLVKVDEAIRIGGYFDDLFIDMVDIDFSLAMRCAGFLVGIATNARMKHQVGELESNRFLFFNVEYLSHSPVRFYYIYRNRLIVCKKYMGRMPVYCMKMYLILFLASFRILGEKDAKEKLRMTVKGIRDGMAYKKGDAVI